jgi:hypothetical protein
VLREHSSAELSEWRAFDAAFGFGVEDDIRAGEVAAAVWNAAGGIPDGPKRRRWARRDDFFPKLAADGDSGDGDAGVRRGRVSHDDTDPVDVDPTDDDLDDLVDEEAEIARVSEAMRNMWAMYGLKRNAQLRAAAELDAGEPPTDADLN